MYRMAGNHDSSRYTYFIEIDIISYGLLNNLFKKLRRYTFEMIF